ncbi:MAG: hypothetical protein Kow0059_00350 [Candidatus Sumerlaeia bacterium]
MAKSDPIRPKPRVKPAAQSPDFRHGSGGSGALPETAAPRIAGGIAAFVLIFLGPWASLLGFRAMIAQHYAALAQEALRTPNKIAQVESNALKAIRLFPANGFVHHLLGSYYRIQGRHQEAIVHLEQARRTSPHPAQSLHALGEVALHGGALSPAEGVAAFEKGLRMWPRPQPEPAYVWYEAGVLAVNNGMAARAVMFMTRSQNLLREQEQDIAVAKAEAFEKLGLTRTAALYLLRQLLQNPGYAEASNQLLRLCRDTEAFAEGRWVLETVRRVRGDSAGLQAASTALEFMAKDFDQAELHARRALQLDPSLASPHYFLCEIYMERRQWEQARRHCLAYIERSGPDDPQIKAVRRHLEDIDRRSAP